MAGLAQYILHVTSAALICAIVLSVTKKGPSGEMIRLLCGVILTFTALQPLTGLDLQVLATSSAQFQRGGEAAAASGKAWARSAAADIIKGECEAYILDKAAALRAEVEVEIELSQDAVPVPIRAEIRGNLSPYHRLVLSDVLQEELGIAKEDQRWSGGTLENGG